MISIAANAAGTTITGTIVRAAPKRLVLGASLGAVFTLVRWTYGAWDHDRYLCLFGSYCIARVISSVTISMANGS